MVYQRPSIFRKKAIAQFHDAEEINQTVSLLSKKNKWLFAGTGLVFVSVFLWLFLGSLTMRFTGEGIFLNGHFRNLMARADGQLDYINIEPGTHVEAGQILATLKLPKLADEIVRLKYSVQNLKDEKLSLIEQKKRVTAGKREQFLNVRTRLVNRLQVLMKRNKFIRYKGMDVDGMFERGIISESERVSIRHEQEDLVRSEKDLKLKIEDVESQFSRLSRRIFPEVLALETKIEQLSRVIAQKEYLYKKRAIVKAGENGKVVDVFVQQGDMVRPGQRLAVINPQEGGQPYKVVAYVSESQYLQLKEGMKVEVLPSLVKNKQVGFLNGMVSTVSDLPVDVQTIKRYFRSSWMLDRLKKNQAFYEVTILLNSDQYIQDKRVWKTTNGQQIDISNGMMCEASFIVKKEVPLYFVAPFLKQSFGG